MTTGIRRTTRLIGRAAATLAVMLLAAAVGPGAQTITPGQNIAPVFEGWEPNSDGSFDLVFGYFNRNWEEIDVPIGPNNAIAPGEPDRGQPTHFYPQRMRFLFRVRVPKDFGNQELVWTLTLNGKTERAYGTLKPDYILSKAVYMANSGESSGLHTKNLPPVLKVEGDQTRQVKVGTPVTLTALVTDDGLPPARPNGRPGTGQQGTPQGATGLRFSWFVYRAADKVTFDPPQFSAWEDLRDARNSPYSPGWVTPPAPPGNTWVVRATFSEPGMYVLRGLAHDGGLSAASDITFVVSR